jgi:transcriptional regulator with XRE-family HTH domain
MLTVGVISTGMTPDSPLRRWRRKNHFTQKQLARAVGASSEAVARWEKAERPPGGRKPAGKLLVKLLQLTRLPAPALIFPERYLQEHPDFLAAFATKPQSRGRPKRTELDD